LAEKLGLIAISPDARFFAHQLLYEQISLLLGLSMPSSFWLRSSDYSARAELVLKRSKWAIWYGTDGGAVAAAPAGNAAMGVLREASEASGEEAEAEEGGERQCEGAFHDRSPYAFASAEGVQHPGMPLIFVVE
jgi:hypothetical protein